MGVPGLTMDYYPSNTIRWETLFVKGKGQEVWGWSGGSAGEKSKTPRLQSNGGAPGGGCGTGRARIDSRQKCKESMIREGTKGPAMKKQATLRSGGRITVPREILRLLGVSAGDHVLFEEDGDGVRISAVGKESPFEKYRGIGNPGIGKGKKAIQKWLRELRSDEPILGDGREQPRIPGRRRKSGRKGKTRSH